MHRALLIPSLCVALGPTAALGQAPATDAQAVCTARDPITAEITAKEAVRLAKAEQYATAEALLLTATRLDPCTSKYRYLLGRAHDLQDEYDAAATAYRLVMERFPTSVEFSKAQGALVKMQARRSAASKAAEATEAARKAEAEREAAAKRKAEAARKAEAERKAEADRRARLAGDPPPDAVTADGTTISGPVAVDDTPWAVIGALTAGVGVVALGAGVGFSLAAQAADDDLALAATRPDRARYDELVDERDTFSTLGWAGYGVGAALVIGGLTLVLVDDDPPLAVAPTRGGATVGFTGRF